MPRLARTVCARVPHHITQRGNRRETVFFTDDDRQAYLGWLQYVARMERSAIRESAPWLSIFPHSAALHAGYVLSFFSPSAVFSGRGA